LCFWAKYLTWSKMSGTSGFIAKYHHLLPPSLWQPTIHMHVSIQAVGLSLETSLWTMSSDSVNQENFIIRFQCRQIILESFFSPNSITWSVELPRSGMEPTSPAMEAQNLNTVPPGKSPRVFLTWIWGAEDIWWEDWYWATTVIQGRYYWMWNEDSVGEGGGVKGTGDISSWCLKFVRLAREGEKFLQCHFWSLSWGMLGWFWKPRTKMLEK